MTPKCCGEVVQNEASGHKFYYCRGCKKEPGVAEKKAESVNKLEPQPFQYFGAAHGHLHIYQSTYPTHNDLIQAADSFFKTYKSLPLTLYINAPVTIGALGPYGIPVRYDSSVAPQCIRAEAQGKIWYYPYPRGVVTP